MKNNITSYLSGMATSYVLLFIFYGWSSAVEAAPAPFRMDWNMIILGAIGLVNTAIISFAARRSAQSKSNSDTSLQNAQEAKINTEKVVIETGKIHEAVNSGREKMENEIRSLHVEIKELEKSKAKTEQFVQDVAVARMGIASSQPLDKGAAKIVGTIEKSATKTVGVVKDTGESIVDRLKDSADEVVHEADKAATLVKETAAVEADKLKDKK